MQRRSFLLAAGAGALGLGSAAGFARWQEIPARIDEPGRLEGHFLRDAAQGRQSMPAPGKIIDTDVLILGSGIAGLTCAWKLRKEGQKRFIVLDGPQPYGNAAGGAFGELACPTGAHYLPIPGAELPHVREILHDAGIILRDHLAARPLYDERFLMHAPEERILFQGKWQEGLLPTDGVPEFELQERQRFFDYTEGLRKARGSDGKPVFALPSFQSSRDAQWLALDKLSFKAWLDQNGYAAPSLHWYLNYCCRDDYGRRYDEISAWAGLHYFCSRHGEAANADKGTWLTWDDGLQHLARFLDQASGAARMSGSAVALDTVAGGVQAHCIQWQGGQPHSVLIRARKAVCAMPLFVAARVVKPMRDYGFVPARHLPAYAPWIVSNFLMKDFPKELPEAPLSWDNVVYGEPGLGYTVSTHQHIRQMPPAQTVFTAYRALSDMTPQAARAWMSKASPAELMAAASSDLKAAYGWRLAACVAQASITLRAHAMAVPAPGFRSNAGLQALREHDGPILFAHADLSGFSLFEEASWWGWRAAEKALS